MMMHSLVWHKGKLYRIGGRPDPSSTATNIHIFDFDSNSWSADILFTNTAYFSTNATLALQKYSAAACSFGDEIFVFGGYNSSGDLQSTAFAWNPESTVVRQLGDMPVAKAGLTAVPCGSSIYLIGGTSDASVYKFTP
jgi:N-acetylneuraminic acid mutarotase